MTDRSERLKVNLDMVGCRLNQSEIETMGRQFRAAGHSLLAEAGGADLVVINTCAVTAPAVSDSRAKVRQAERAGAGRIVVTGCWATLDPAAAASLPGVTDVVPNDIKDRLAAELLSLPTEAFDREPLAREPLPGARLRTRAFIKVQDGCDNRCTFCVTTIARGAGRSRPAGEILREIQFAQAGGVQEVVLTGVHLGSWGQDMVPARHLSDLVRAALERTDIPRLRLSSLEPWDLDAGFFELWQDPRLCPHLHLPLQSGSAATLRRMARKTTPVGFAELVTAARRAAPDIAITTDIIAGFPGESDSEFAESLAFVRDQEFAGAHVFSYSSRPGTAAAAMPNQVPHALRKERSGRLRAAVEDSAERYRTSFIGRNVEVLWESTTELGPTTWVLHGLSGNYLRVKAEAPRALQNHISRVRVTDLSSGQLAGQIV